MFKIIAEFENGEHKSLLIELPQVLLVELKVSGDGCVSAKSFLKFLSKYRWHRSAEISTVERINIYDTILNPARVAR